MYSPCCIDDDNPFSQYESIHTHQGGPFHVLLNDDATDGLVSTYIRHRIMVIYGMSATRCSYIFLCVCWRSFPMLDFRVSRTILGEHYEAVRIVIWLQYV